MSIATLISTIETKEVITTGGIILLIVMTFVQLAPIKINPWTWVGKKIGRSINGELIDKVDTLEQEIKQGREETKKEAAINCRIRILRFGDEISHQIKHTKDHFCQTLEDIDRYEAYCAGHKDFKNGMTESSVAIIKETYKRQCENNDFI